MAPVKRYIKPEMVKRLEDAVFAIKCKKFEKHQAPETLLKQQFRDDKANDLTRCITTYIQLKGGQAERINTTGRPIDRRKQFIDSVGITRTIGSIEWVPGTSTNGSADISATIRGRSVKIEVKIGRDFQSQAQKDYQKAIEAAGGLYVIAKDFTSFVTWYHKTFTV